MLRRHGILDPDAEWGQYSLLRTWDEQKFLASLRRAENTPLGELNPDGNRAVIFCSTTDPYQTFAGPSPEKNKVLNALREKLVRRSLELILERSTLNVRILTRSPLARQDFALYRRFGPRLVFGMSLPTLEYVAMAPTYPDCAEADLQQTLSICFSSLFSLSSSLSRLASLSSNWPNCRFQSGERSPPRHSPPGTPPQWIGRHRPASKSESCLLPFMLPGPFGTD